MTEDYQNVQTKMAAVRIETELYDRVTRPLHQGQLTALFRAFFESLDEKIKDDKFIEITNYLYKADSITLEPIKEKI